MGGAALIIPGLLDEKRQGPVPANRNLIDRLTCRTRMLSPKIYETPKGTKGFDFPCEELGVLENRFREYLNDQLRNPWPASKAVIEYLDMGICKIFMRARQSVGAKKPKFYLQIGFSGCAGMSEISAMVAYHWADIWFRAEQKNIERNILIPYGFTAQGKRSAEKLLFLPLKECGYAHFVTDNAKSERVEGDAALEIDEGLQGYKRESADSLNEKLNAFAHLFKDGKCRCQFCAPEFDFASVKGLPI